MREDSSRVYNHTTRHARHVRAHTHTAQSIAPGLRCHRFSFASLSRHETSCLSFVSPLSLIISPCLSLSLLTAWPYGSTYTRLRMSFWKHDPPNPTDARRNEDPIRESLPTARATSSTSALVASHSSEMALIEEMRCARNALATSFGRRRGWCAKEVWCASQREECRCQVCQVVSCYIRSQRKRRRTLCEWQCVFVPSN